MATTTFIYPVFSIYLKVKFDLSVEVSSLFFIISMATYFLTISSLNNISEKIGVKMTIAAGLFINSIAVLFLAPASFLPQ
jgi:fucose permease